jgi:hypothetical protein
MQGLGLYYNYKGVIVNAQANRDVQLGAQRMTVDVANSSARATRRSPA